MQIYIALALVFLSVSAFAAELPLEKLRVPGRWKINVYSSEVKGARSLTPGPNGVAFHKGDLYIAEIDRILVLHGLKDLAHPPKPQPWGRPVDVLELNDGSVLISDDKTGAVYRSSRAK